VLAAGVIVGLSTLPLAGLRTPLVALFVVVAVLSSTGPIRTARKLWRDTAISTNTAGFYARPAWTQEWSNILDLAASKRLMMLSYAGGIHHFFPRVQTADTWFLQPAQVFDADKQRLLLKMRDQEIIVQDLSGPTDYVDNDPEIQQRLASMCLVQSNRQLQNLAGTRSDFQAEMRSKWASPCQQPEINSIAAK